MVRIKSSWYTDGPTPGCTGTSAWGNAIDEAVCDPANVVGVYSFVHDCWPDKEDQPPYGVQSYTGGSFDWHYNLTVPFKSGRHSMWAQTWGSRWGNQVYECVFIDGSGGTPWSSSSASCAGSGLAGS